MDDTTMDSALQSGNKATQGIELYDEGQEMQRGITEDMEVGINREIACAALPSGPAETSTEFRLDRGGKYPETQAAENDAKPKTDRVDEQAAGCTELSWQLEVRRGIDELRDSILESIQPLPTPRTTARRHLSQPGAFAVQSSHLFVLSSSASSLRWSNDASNVESTMGQSVVPFAIAEAEPVPATSTLQRAQEYYPNSATQKRKHLSLAVLCSCVGLAIILTIIIPVALLTLSNNYTKSPDKKTPNIPTIPPPFEERIQRLLPEETRKNLQRGDLTAQSRAVEWLKRDPSIDQYPNERILQRFALATLFLSTNGPGWFHRDDWMTYTGHECEWFSQNVSNLWPNVVEKENPCDENATLYTKLWLQENNMNGNVPDELYLLTSLTSLSLYYNPELKGTISSSIGQLTNLNTLYLASLEGLSGSLPTELGLLSQLTDLQLLNCKLEGTIPSQLGGLTDLKYLFMDSNQLSGTIPSQLANLSDLIHLYLFNNKLTGHLPTELAMLSHLEHLSLDGNCFSGAIPSEYGLFSSSLMAMVLYNNELTGTLPSQLGALNSMAGFFADGNRLTGTIPSEFGYLGNLERLNLSQNLLTGTLPTDLARLVNLTQFYVWNNFFSGTLFPEMGGMTTLKWLGVRENIGVGGPIPSELGQLSQLLVLSLRDMSLTGTIPSELGSLVSESLLQLDISGSTSMTLSGTIPSLLCRVGTNVTCPKFKVCGLIFDCLNTSRLCGCGCPCTN